MRFSKSKASRLFGANEFRLLTSLFTRRGITPQRRLICSLASLQAIGDSSNLINMLDMAINGPSDIEIVYEILLQGYLFCGYPKAIESFFCLDGVLRNKKLSLHRKLPILIVSGDLASSRGMTLARKIHRDKFSKIHNKISALCPDLGYLMLAEGYGHILSRNGADLATRELAVISSLSASAAFRQLNSHIRGAMNIGCDRKEILEAILTGLPWAGITAVRNSLTIWSKVLEAPIPSIEILKNYISTSV